MKKVTTEQGIAVTLRGGPADGQKEIVPNERNDLLVPFSVPMTLAMLISPEFNQRSCIKVARYTPGKELYVLEFAGCQNF
jgi:hypothetical protein